MHGEKQKMAGTMFLVCWGITAPVLAAEPQRPVSQSDASARPSIDVTAQARIAAQAEARIRKAMQTRVTREFFEAPLNQVVQILAGDAKIPVIVDEPAFEEEGFAPDRPIRAHFRNATLEQALDRMLEPLQLTWVIEDEVLKITTQIRAEDIRTTRVYNVGKLLVYNVGKLLAARYRAKECVPGGEERVCGVGVVPCLPGCDAWLPNLIGQVTQGPWRRIQGTRSTMTLIGDLLVVHQSRFSQQEVAELLDAMRKFVAGDVSGRSIAVSSRIASVDDVACCRALQKKASVNLIDTALKDLVEYMDELIEAPFVLDETALKNEGIRIDTPINLKLDDVTAHAVLANALKPLRLTFLVEDGVIKVTSQIAANGKHVVYLYDVRDLVNAEYGEQDLIDMLQMETSGPWHDLEGGSGTIATGLPGLLVVRQIHKVHAEIAVLLDAMRNNAAEAPAVARRAEHAALDRYVLQFYPVQDINQAGDLQAALMALIAPDSWQQEDSEAAIHMVGNTLVIRQTLRVQNQIAEFIRHLRAAQPRKGQGGALF